MMKKLLISLCFSLLMAPSVSSADDALSFFTQNSEPPPAPSCMTRDQIHELTKVIACQQMVNPVACDELSSYLDEQYYARQPMYSPGTIALAAGLGAQRLAMSNSRFVKAWAATKEAMTAFGRGIAEVTGARQFTQAAADRMTRLAQNVRSAGGRHFASVVNRSPDRFTPEMLRTIATRLTGTGATTVATVATQGAGRTVAAQSGRMLPRLAGAGARLFTGPYALAASVIYEVGNAYGHLHERVSGCRADV